MSDFLADCAERIIVLSIVHRRIINRFHKFILWLGIPLHRVQDTKPNEFSRIVSEFALEYRTTRERVIQQLEKKANHRERNKTRGKMITEVSGPLFFLFVFSCAQSIASFCPLEQYRIRTWYSYLLGRFSSPSTSISFVYFKVGKFRTKEDRADAELRQLLGSDISDVESLHGTLPWRRQRKDGKWRVGVC